MAKNNVYLYIVEGDCEQHALSYLKKEYIESGKVLVLNPLQREITKMMIRNFKENTIAILIFDTDTTDGTEKLEKNIEILKKAKNIKDIVIIPQVENFEDELIRASSIKKIEEFTNSKTRKDFKRDFLANKNLSNLFQKNKFDIKKFWIGVPRGLYKSLKNEAIKIKRIH